MSTLPLVRRALVRVTSTTVAVITAVTLALSAGVFATAPASPSPLATTPHAPKYTPKFEPGPCAAGVPNEPRVECGVLTVPENRDRPQKAQVQLSVATVQSQAATKAPDPIVHLAGGPGQAAFPILNFVLATDLGGPRDVIVLSQRGTPASTPNLDCPELTDATWAQFATADPPAVEQRTYDEAVRQCRARLRASGVDLNSYNTVTNAADVADLRVALGVRDWNIWSLSYGTTLAQQVMRDHPDGLRSVVLDSTVPPDKGFGGTDEVGRAMDSIKRLLAGCATSPACNAAHPTLARDLKDVVAALDAHPYQSVVTDPDGAQRAIAFTGRDLIYGLANIPRISSLISQFPQLVSQFKAGQYGFIDTLASTLIPQLYTTSDGMHLSVQCADRAHIDVQAGLRRLLAAHPEYEAVGTGVFAACPAWPVRPVPRSFNHPITSAIPTLVLAGEWDPTTPATAAREVAKHFKRSSFVEFPGAGHVVVRFDNPCAQSMLQGFFANPTQRPVTTCVRQLPEPAWS
jgi:pimeloyl-ACP methyl ester carboxylesterase